MKKSPDILGGDSGGDPGRDSGGDPWLLTPGPLSTSSTVKQAMLRDLGSRDSEFIDANARVLARLAEIAGGGELAVVPLQGSGTFVVEAMIGCFVPPDGKVLVCVNGAYGRRIAEMCEYAPRAYQTLESAEDTPVDADALERALAHDASITHVAAVQCETTSGILNPLAQIAARTAAHGRRLLIDAMSAFGALPLPRGMRFDALAASANKCLEGAPGIGFCIAPEAALARTEGNAHSLSLDLHAQWRAMQQNGQWRFTPPTHVLLALDRALTEFLEEGGVAGRGRRYRHNCELLLAGMRAMGFKPLLAAELQAPIIVTFHMPRHPKFRFAAFYDGLRRRGYVIYPGKLTIADSFRIGCIGRIGAAQIKGALAAVRETLNALGIKGAVE